MRSNLRFVLAYLRLNLSAAVEYRAAFLAQALGMMLNDLVFIIFWGLYFARIPECWRLGHSGRRAALGGRRHVDRVVRRAAGKLHPHRDDHRPGPVGLLPGFTQRHAAARARQPLGPGRLGRRVLRPAGVRRLRPPRRADHWPVRGARAGQHADLCRLRGARPAAWDSGLAMPKRPRSRRSKRRSTSRCTRAPCSTAGFGC